MSRENERATGISHTELSSVREQVSILAEQVGRLLDMISRQDARGEDTRPAEEKLAVLENLMWKLHARHNRLKSAAIVMH